MKTILLAASFSIVSLAACGQTTGNQNTQKEDLKTQAEQRRNYPDNPNKQVVIADKNSKDSAAVKPKKKRKCWFSKKKKEKEIESAADYQKSQEEKDPNLRKKPDTNVESAKELKKGRD